MNTGQIVKAKQAHEIFQNGIERCFKTHDLFNNVDFFNFPTRKKRHVSMRGCYKIGDVYIGATIHLRKRILQHLSKYKHFIRTGKPTGLNLKILYYLHQCDHTAVAPKIYYLSDDPYLEEEYHKIYGLHDPNNQRPIYYHEFY